LQEHLGGILTPQILYGLIFAHSIRLAGYWFCRPGWSGQQVNPLIYFYFLARKGLAQLTPEN
jgi:hypothetical protein